MNIITQYLTAKVPKSVKKKLYKKYKGCQKCGGGVFQSISRHDNYLEIHHKISKSKGGTDAIDNLELLCKNCHDKLHEMTGSLKKKLYKNLSPSVKRELYLMVKKYFFITPKEFYSLILQDEDGFALLINLVNKAAKEINEYYYKYKVILLNRLLKTHSHAWIGKDNYGDKVVYAETYLGQVSFHFFENVKNYSGRSEEKWSGKHNQEIADKLLKKHILNHRGDGL
jgi:hypothetical protein